MKRRRPHDYRELLRTQHAFRRLWLGQVVSEIGDWLQFVALVGLFPTRGAAAERPDTCPAALSDPARTR